MPAAVIGGVIAGAGAIGAAAIGSSAQKRATQQTTDAATRASEQNLALQTEARDYNRNALAPYMSQGGPATASINSLLYGTDGGASLKALEESPGYQFRQRQGNSALNTQWAARGLLNSGAAQKSAMKFNQDFASGERTTRLNELMQQQGVGLTAANALAGVSTNFANQVGGQNNALASVQANAALANGQSSANLFGAAASALGQIGGSLMSSYKPPSPKPWYGDVQGGGMYPWAGR